MRTRRSFLHGGVLAALSCAVTAPPGDDRHGLRARPGAVTTTPLTPGRISTIVGATLVDAYLPATRRPGPVPCFLFLHGARRNVPAYVQALQPALDETGVLMVAPHANGNTWDLLLDGYGQDVVGIDGVLRWLFARVEVDPRRMCLAGFSDGATYTLALGRANGDLFPRLAAFSPGGLLQTPVTGKPAVHVVHGTNDEVLPFAVSRDVIVPTLRSDGYPVTFESFSGGHGLPVELA
ncbi:MAG: phospholipase, partial [Gemmatimonadetes bacterium]|nr:phospholipase [Gemmatimonadota bacterium]